MARQISEDLKQRMQRARKRKELGFTQHLEIAGRMAMKKVEELFKEWDVDVKDTLFQVTAMDWQYEVLFDRSLNDLLQAKGVKVKEVINKAVEFLERKDVSEIGIECSEDKVLRATEQTGNVVFVRKAGVEFLIESYSEWNERLGGECDRCAKKVGTK